MGQTFDELRKGKGKKTNLLPASTAAVAFTAVHPDTNVHAMRTNDNTVNRRRAWVLLDGSNCDARAIAKRSPSDSGSESENPTSPPRRAQKQQNRSRQDIKTCQAHEYRSRNLT